MRHYFALTLLVLFSATQIAAANTLSLKERTAIKTIFKDLVGAWNGKGLEIRYKSANEKSEVSWVSDLVVQKYNSYTWVFKEDFFIPDKNVSKSKDTYWRLENRRLYFGGMASNDEVEVISVNNNILEMKFQWKNPKNRNYQIFMTLYRPRQGVWRWEHKLYLNSQLIEVKEATYLY